MSPLEESAHSWLLKARDDLIVATVGVSEKQYALGLYHYQQSIEKSLKAFLLHHDVDFPRIHNLEKLLAFCVKIDSLPRSDVIYKTQI